MSDIAGTSYSEPCPYIPGKLSTIEIYPGFFSPELYESLLQSGWRRSGGIFYRYTCPSCALCTPLRLSFESLKLSGRLRRIQKKNSDLKVKLVYPSMKDEYFLLYEKYCKHRHFSTESSDVEGFQALFAYVSSALAEYRSDNGSLLGLGFLDILPNGFSSVYFVFDPISSRRSLGYFSVLKEASLALESGRQWYYLGFWIPDSLKMDYKADFKPFQIAPRHSLKWIDTNDRAEAKLCVQKLDA